MNYKKFKLISWNVRGLGNPDKCRVVCDVIRKSRGDICMLQETKLNDMNFNYVSLFLPTFFNFEVAYKLANGSKGGMVVAWKKHYQLINSWATKNTLTVVLKNTKTNEIAQFTTVYGPSVEVDKPEFISELKNVLGHINHPWIIAGDFNLVRWLVDRSGDYREFGLMDSFNELIRDAGLIDVQLKNRKYTWSSKRPEPTFSKLDRVLTTVEWTLSYPIITLEALELVVSDHVPLVLFCRNEATARRRHKIENFWLKYEAPKLMVQTLWGSIATLPQASLLKFHANTKALHISLAKWQKEGFGDMEKQLAFCKKAVLFFDAIEEHRPLVRHEFRMRCLIKERVFELANNLEEKWRQRSRCKWLKEGDKNTRFFHACASSRRWTNSVPSITYQGLRRTETKSITEAFYQSMKGQLGYSNRVQEFDPHKLYEACPNSDLSSLQDPFMLEEVECAMRQLAKNKASGPDGLTNEFLHAYWHIVKEDIMLIMHGFHQGILDLTQINKANVIMVPKKEQSEEVGDFRPISVINLVPKLISKILSNRLRTKMPELVSAKQTAFIQGRQISENFVATREVFQHIAQAGQPAIFLKLDFAKAFDSIEWEFLFHILAARGFPSRWLQWIRMLLQTASSRVLINGDESVYFKHRRGLRQGDPLSPMLFNIAVDVFQQMVMATNRAIEGGITQRISDSILAYQYADDTAIVASASITALISLKIVIRLFSSVSGLKVNYQKNSFIPLNVAQEDLGWVQAVLGCNRTHFPTTYLGMPLSITKPRKEAFIPLIEKIERKLGGWKGKMISRGGRLQLVQSVLSTVPVYHMSCFCLPQWVILRIDKIRRAFLWAKPITGGSGISLTNWEMACIAKPWGGLGISNLYYFNISVLLRWWWKAYFDKGCLWTVTIRLLRRRGAPHHETNIWLMTGSFFWNQLQKIKYIFNMCTEWNIGNGKTISFWFDSWNGEPGTDGSGYGLTRPTISLRDAWPRRQILNSELVVTRDIQFNSEQDVIQWKLEPSGIYTSKSIYRVLIGGGKTEWVFNYTWKCPVPPTVKIFIYLVLNDKILSRDVLSRRGMSINLNCALCGVCRRETTLHMLFYCHYATTIWRKVSAVLRTKIMTAATTIQETWTRSWEVVRQNRGMSRRAWATCCICTVWHIWKQRNRVVFGDNANHPTMVADRVVREYRLWLKHC